MSANRSLTTPSQTSSTSCCLDQLLVSKSSSTSTCIFGAADNGVQFGIHAANYLLCKLLSNQRYSRIICVCLDRRPDCIISTVEAYFDQLQVQNGESEQSSNQALSKLRIIEGSVTEAKDLNEISDAVIKQIETDNSTIGLAPIDSDDQTSKKSNSSMTAILLYSMSELVLAVGMTKAVGFTNRLLSLSSAAKNAVNTNTSSDSSNASDQNQTAAAARSASPDSRCSVSLIALVHTSLHSAHTLSRLLPHPAASFASSSGHPFNASVIVKPNDGSLSAQILCEMQVVKVSSLTGKVLEASNYFTQSQGHALLIPIVTVGAKREEEEPVKALSTAVNSSNFSISKEDQEKERERDQERARAAGPKSRGHDNRRLITFDSTDPEFDEDSDPDADLDI